MGRVAWREPIHLCTCVVYYMYTPDKCFYVYYYESLQGALKTKTIYGYRCDERLKTNVEESTRLACTPYYESIIRSGWKSKWMEPYLRVSVSSEESNDPS